MMETQVLKFFGKHLRELRTEKGLSQSELAFKGDFDRNYIGMLERGERNPSLKNLKRLSDALEITLCRLINFENNDKCK
jgi:transcriptional regulator with XRE-family HTH domain